VSGGGASRLERDLEPFGFDGDGWLEHARSASAALRVGALGGFADVEEVGRGGQSVVFRASQPGTDRPVALKRLRAGSLASASAHQRFEREVEIASRLRHPGLVSVYGLERVDDLPVLVMEWVDGVPCTEWAAARRDDPRAVLELGLAIAEAVAHAHRKGVLHRDLKPSNILVEADGRPRVLDFGLAKLGGPGPGDATESGAFVGTPAYASPEQWTCGVSGLDARSDVYSLGVVLFEMLTGRHPFPARLRRGEAADDTWSRRAPRTASVGRPLGRELDVLLDRALSPDPDGRYRSMDALAEDLERYLTGRPILAHPPGSAYLVRKLVRRYPVTAASLGLALLVTLALTAVVGVQNRAIRAQRDQERELRTAAQRALSRESEARRAESRARRDAEAAEREAEDALRLAVAARDAAERATRREAAAATFLMDAVTAQLDPVTGAPDRPIRDVLPAMMETIDERLPESADLQAYLLAQMAHMLIGIDRLDLARGYAQRALAIYASEPGAPPDGLVGQPLLALAGAERERGRFDAACATYAQAIELFERAGEGNLDSLAIALSGLGFAELGRDRPSAARGAFRRALELCERSEQLPALVLQLEIGLASAEAELGETSSASARLERAIEEAREVPDGGGALLTALQTKAALALRGGDRATLHASLREAADVAAATYGEGDFRALSIAAGRGLELARDGQRAEASSIAERLDAQLEDFEPTSLRASVEVLRPYGYLLLALGREPEFAEVFVGLVDDLAALRGEDAEDTRLALDHLGPVLVTLDRPDEALPYLERAMAIRARCFEPDSARTGEGVGYMGMYYAAKGRYAAARELFDEALGILGAAQDRGWLDTTTPGTLRSRSAMFANYREQVARLARAE